MIEADRPKKTLTLHGLYVKDVEELKEETELPRKPNPDDVTAETPGIGFFCVEGSAHTYDGDYRDIIKRVLKEHNIQPWNVVEYTTSKVETVQRLDIDPYTFTVPQHDRGFIRNG